MKVYQVQNYRYSNYYVQSKKQTPSFTSIKSENPDGLYRKNAGETLRVSEALQKCPEATDFFEKYDVNIGYHAAQKGDTLYESSLHILYTDPTSSFFTKIFGGKKEIAISGFGSSLEKSTDQLIKYILPEGNGSNLNGGLSSRINTAVEEIQKKLNQKNAKIAAKNAKKQAKIDAKNKQKADEKALQDAIKEHTGK